MVARADLVCFIGTRTGGMRGLADGLSLVAALCERYWDGVHPLADEDGVERRIGILRGRRVLRGESTGVAPGGGGS